MKRFVILLLVAGMLPCASLTVKAQERSKVEADIAADIVTQYIWRGQDLGNVSFQPSLGVSYKGLSLSAWGSVGLSEPSDTKEFDLTLAYSVGGLNLGVTDYWFNAGQDERNRYFLYDSHSTNHVFEANIGYDFGVCSLQAYTNFAGNDGVDKDGDRAYSTYIEAAAPFTLAGLDWEATAGVVPFATSFYGTSGFSVTNIAVKATKAIRITDKFELPVFASVAANPQSQKAYFVFGFTIK